MKANDADINSLLTASRIFEIPIFQRDYSWGEELWEILHEDIVTSIENTIKGKPPHFIGTIVTSTLNVDPVSDPRFIIIDGQQRLWTLTLYLVALREHIFNLLEKYDDIKSQDITKSKEEIKDWITEINRSYLRFRSEPKIKLNKKDRDSGKKICFSEAGSLQQTLNEVRKTNNNFVKAYNFFYSKIEDLLRKTEEESEELAKAELKEDEILDHLFKGIGKLRIVNINLDDKDDENIIFESLNAKGLELSQADLIRNQIFLLVHGDQASEIHSDYWEPMSERIGNSKLMTDFFRRYLMIALKKNIHKKSVYYSMKEHLRDNLLKNVETEEEITEKIRVELQNMLTYSEYYIWLFKPELVKENLPEDVLRSATNYEKKSLIEQIKFINIWGFDPGRSFLMLAFSLLAERKIVIKQLLETLEVLESYLVRRHICNISPKDYYVIMIKTIKKLIESFDNYENPLKEILLENINSSRNPFPEDEEFESNFVNFEAYSAAKNKMCKMMLYRINQYYDRKPIAKIDDLEITIEHVFPQNHQNWTAKLGETMISGMKTWINRFGNLTLTNKNPELSNMLFQEKCELYKDSAFKITKDIAKKTDWTSDEMEERTKKMAKIAIEIWKKY
ncbi:MAG: DUF262 domain-containing protein [Candidatus Heimdallarchaeaceae archaeon]